MFCHVKYFTSFQGGGEVFFMKFLKLNSLAPPDSLSKIKPLPSEFETNKLEYWHLQMFFSMNNWILNIMVLINHNFHTLVLF